MKTMPPPLYQLFIDVVAWACIEQGFKCSLLGFSRGAFWASYFALHMPRLSKLAVRGYDPEPGEEEDRIVLHGAAMEPQVLMVQSPSDQLCPFSKAKLFEQGLRQKPHNQFIEIGVSHERLFNIMQIDDRCAENFNHLGQYILMFATQVAPEEVEA